MKKVQWDKIRYKTKITLKKDMVLKGFNDEMANIKTGVYFITGFHADMCGLSTIGPNNSNDVCIQSTELKYFYK